MIYLMIGNKSFTQRIQEKYRDYGKKVNLTEEARTRNNGLINDLEIVNLIITTVNPSDQKIIEDKLKDVEKALDSRLKNQGWLTYFSQTNDVIPLD